MRKITIRIVRKIITLRSIRKKMRNTITEITVRHIKEKKILLSGVIGITLLEILERRLL